MSNIAAARTALSEGVLQFFMPLAERQALLSTLRGEEAAGMADIVNRIVTTVTTMPKVYETDGEGMDAVVKLHYFKGGIDAWITERDTSDGQHQAFGYVDLGYGGELGYVSIQELIDAGCELDLYWTEKTLREALK
jgi:hypothetical protein